MSEPLGETDTGATQPSALGDGFAEASCGGVVSGNLTGHGCAPDIF